MASEDIISENINPPESLLADDVEANPATSGNGLKQRQTRLSIVSKNYDIGNKGYLDKDERALRAYDTNNDGSLDVNEMKKIIGDLRGFKNEKNFMKKIACVASAAVAIVILCNFGLVWTTLVLTRQVGTQNGSLVDSSTGEKISTRASNLGNHVVAKANPEYARRLVQLHGRRVLSRATGAVGNFSFHEEYRRLNGEVPLATLEDSGEDLQKIFHDYEDGTIPTVSIEVEGTTYTGSVASGVSFTPQVGGCDVYNNIKEQGTEKPTYEIKCCGTAKCEVKHLGSSRRLQTTVVGGFTDPFKTCNNTVDCNSTDLVCEMATNNSVFECGTLFCGVAHEGEKGCYKTISVLVSGPSVYTPDSEIDTSTCFSSLSTIMEKSKGEMFLKDLKTGDLVLAANGKYRPFVFSADSSPSKLTHFVQIHTGSSNDAPFEATPGHLVFLHGKDLPIQVGKVEVGDLMVGVDGPRAVTKITSVMRKGFYGALTSDATLVVDGVLASSTSTLTGEAEGDEYVPFGLFQVHFHTLMNRVGAPLIHFMCSRINSYYCTTQVEDESGGSVNVLISTGRAVLALPLPLQPLIFTFFIVAFAISMICYLLVLFLVPSAILLGINTHYQLKFNKKEKHV